MKTSQPKAQEENIQLLAISIPTKQKGIRKERFHLRESQINLYSDYGIFQFESKRILLKTREKYMWQIDFRLILSIRQIGLVLVP